jgi:hypothetical protein
MSVLAKSPAERADGCLQSWGIHLLVRTYQYPQPSLPKLTRYISSKKLSIHPKESKQGTDNWNNGGY